MVGLVSEWLLGNGAAAVSEANLSSHAHVLRKNAIHGRDLPHQSLNGGSAEADVAGACFLVISSSRNTQCTSYPEIPLAGRRSRLAEEQHRPARSPV
ncbi:unnamed protein product [Arctogadus glacialis]